MSGGQSARSFCTSNAFIIIIIIIIIGDDDRERDALAPIEWFASTACRPCELSMGTRRIRADRAAFRADRRMRSAEIARRQGDILMDALGPNQVIATCERRLSRKESPRRNSTGRTRPARPHSRNN